MSDPDDSEIELKSEKSVVPSWLWILVMVGLCVLVVVGVDGYLKAGSAERMGQWGDFFGGTLNPILSFLTFAGLIYTILLQRNELGLSRYELKLTRIELARSSTALEDQNLSLKQQRFESTFFGMIGVLNAIIDKMDAEIRLGFGSPVSHFSGRDCFVGFLKDLNEIYRLRSYSDEPSHVYDSFGGISEVIEYPHDLERILKSYDTMYDKHAGDLAHYFRVLYNIFRYIDLSDFSDGVYAKILRAQLSNQELVILYYNCNSYKGKNFIYYAKKYDIFDNIDGSDLVRPDHSEIFDAAVS